MPAALAVVRSLFIKRAVVVVKDQMLAFVADHIRYAPEISFVLRNDEGAGVERHDHSSSVDVAALIVVASGVLARRNSYVWRIVALAILCSVCAGDEDCVVRVVQTVRIAVTMRDIE
ncbi:MAG: hypothetical protein DMF68_19885 [Acidobacteria bacterium]|nr:MAG: hypothetical protein DMF68_19885 [Acidobacteriota bacterium]